MVKHPAFRIRKYEKNVGGEAVGRRVDAVKSVMVDLEKEYLPQIAQVEEKVKRIVEAAGVPSYQVAQYINIGRQCYSIARRFGGLTRDAEHQNVVDKWVSRGLNAELAAKSCNVGGGKVKPGAPPCFNPCDHGERHNFVGADPVTALDAGVVTSGRFGLPRLPDGTSGHVLTAQGPGADPVYAAVPALPTAYNFCKSALAANTFPQGTWLIGINASQFMNGWITNTTHALNDEIVYKFSHKAGSFVLWVLGRVGDWAGISTVTLDGVIQGTIDWYAAAAVFNTLKSLAITIVADGEHTLSFKMTGKNPASSDYYLQMTLIWLRD